MKWLPVAAAAAFGLSTGAQALTFSETTDLPNSASASPIFGAVVVGTLSTGPNVMEGQLGGTCIGGGFANNCTGGDSQDSFLVNVSAGEEITDLAISIESAFGPPGWKLRFVVDKVVGTGVNVALASTGVLELDLPLNAGPFVMQGMPLAAGQYDFSVFAFGDSFPSPGVSGSFDGIWRIDATVASASSELPVPLPPAAAMLAGGIALLGAARLRRNA